ncbi:YigZ family protein [Alteromonas sp. ASW11-36]|uniref:YigZ family protein n=1 Tax=Alteromonas arenosi TaxID=3055817 RepID=A0ABT7SYP1_9ALTE|nr:YigZ family protein [Alteromonas sp. ASW11-36]MDM7861309.1 YigZ family protein [Alteromonas sp. ASW11-36]
MSYPIPAETLETTLEIKKSLFHACAGYAPDREAAMTIIEQCKQRYPDARHHCWAYLLGDPNSPTSAAMNDDGEPSGTAGKPILNVLQHKGIGDIIVVVSRYFGGIKLGAGGLVRAYSGATQQSLEQLAIKKRIARQRYRVECDFKHEQYLRLWLEQHNAVVRGCDYAQGAILDIAIPASKLAELDNLLASLSNSRRLSH